MLTTLVWTAEHPGSLSVIHLVVLAVVAAAALAVGRRYSSSTRARGISAVATLVCGGAMVITGEVAMAMARREVATYRAAPEGDLRALDAVVAAALSPFRRSAALQEFSAALDARDDPDGSLIAARAALHRAGGDARGAASLWMDHGSPEKGARIAEESEAWRLAARGWYLAGEFGRASDAWERGGSGGSLEELRYGVTIHLLNDSLPRAERAARSLATALRDTKTEDGAVRADTASCVADALVARDSSVGRQRPLDVPNEPVSVACACLEADLVDGEERLGLLDARRVRGEDAPRAWLALLRSEASLGRSPVPPPEWESAGAAFISPERWIDSTLPAVEMELAQTLGRQTLGRETSDRVLASLGNASARASLLAELAGSHDLSVRFAWLAQSTAESVEHAYMSDTDGSITPLPPALGALVLRGCALPSITMMTSDTVFTGEAVYFSRDSSSYWLYEVGLGKPRSFATRTDLPVAWFLMHTGQWGELAARLREGTSDVGIFLRFANLASRARTYALYPQERWKVTGSEALLAWVRWGRHQRNETPEPLRLLIQLRSLSDAARGLGDPSLANVLGARASRFQSAILRRATSVPLAVMHFL